MKKIYLLKTYWLNGVHRNTLDDAAFESRELAEKVKAAVEEANKDSELEVVCDMSEIKLMTDESEVPILNGRITTKHGNSLPEPFRTAFERGDSIDYKSIGHPNDHTYVRQLGYEPEMGSDCSYSAKGLKGISLSSYGDWGTAYVGWMDDTSKNIFLEMYDKGIITPWRITTYKSNGCSYEYNNKDGWRKYSIGAGWKPCEPPHTENC